MEKLYLSIKNWNADEQPREKLLAKGPAALSNAELLAILINTGTKNKSAIDIAREILQLANQNLLELGRITVSDLKQIKGLGEKKSVTIVAAMEFGNRRQIETALHKASIKCPKDAVDILKPMLQDILHEEIYVIYMNHASKVQCIDKMSKGGITSAVVDIRMILKKALSLPAVTKMILAHNHPSGSLQISEADIVVTERLKKAALQIDMQLDDHIIIAGDSYVSLRDEGKL